MNDEGASWHGENTCDGTAGTYRIRIRGLLPREWAEWFDGFAISYAAGDDTTLTGRVVDQAALHGLLSRVRDLGLTLLKVERIDLPLDPSAEPT